MSAFCAGGNAALPTRPHYAPAHYELEMSWTEQAPNTPGVLVEGCLFRDVRTGARLERYFTSDGTAVDGSALARMGVSRKHWEPVRKSQPAEFAPASAKTVGGGSAPVPLLAPADVPEIVFPPKDREALLLEDALDQESAKGLMRIGVVDDLVPPVDVWDGGATCGEWRTLADGTRVWALTLRSLDAVGQRVRLSGFSRERGVEVIVHSSGVSGTALAISLDGWSPTCFGEAITVECRVAPGAALSAPFALDGLVYLYTDPAATVEKAGSCNIAVACEAGWATAAMSVGGLAVVSGAAALFCTGTLIADTVPETAVPYLLTANHCVGDVARAGNLEVYWLYQADTCGGEAGTLENSPRTTGGADIVTTSTYVNGTDVSLLQLRGSVPEGIPYAGWTTETAAAGRAVTAIHHPSGAPKCISFGNVLATVDGQRLVPEDRFYAVLWARATTEPGSSGCPLFTGDTGLIAGQLYGGYASCDQTGEPDYFGRMDKSYALLQPYLDPGSVSPPPIEGEGEGQQEGEGEGEEEDDSCCHLFKAATPENAFAALLVVALLMMGAAVPGGKP